jgi:hypothetical protein
MGVSSIEQVNDNLAMISIELSDEQRADLERISAPDQRMLYRLFTRSMRQHAVFGGTSVTPWRSCHTSEIQGSSRLRAEAVERFY